MLTIKEHLEISDDLVMDFEMDIVMFLTVDKDSNLQMSISTPNNSNSRIRHLAALLSARITKALAFDTEPEPEPEPADRRIH